MVNDPIGDFLSQVRNAQLIKREKVELPSSKMLVAIADILKKEGFIHNYSINKEEVQRKLEIEFK
ncbi:30S ribosomal protein S8, partial [Candidatus Dojkabacteria bacterium]|nr:30S ribosomal protein S8 [Candidatus Dojkabacteria bacterium]